MQQFLRVDLKGIIGNIAPLKGTGVSLVVYINEHDQYGNFIKTQKVYVNLFNAAQRLITKQKVRKGDGVIILGAQLNVFERPDGSVLTTIVCNYASQITIIANENHEILNSQEREEQV